MDRIEGAGVVVIMGLADFALKLHVSPVGQIGEIAVTGRERHLRPRVRGQFDSETFAIGRNQSGIDDATFEDGRNVIGNADPGRGWRRMSCHDGDTTEYQRSEAGYECEPAGSREITGERQRSHSRAGKARLPQRDALPARGRETYSHTRRDGDERQEKGLMKAHMALVAMCAEISQKNRIVRRY